MAVTERPGWAFEDGGVSNQSAKGEGSISGGRQGTQGLYEQSSVQHFPLGYRLAFDDGRVFRYAQFDAAVTPAGKLVAPVAATQLIPDGANTAIVDSAGTNAADYASTDNVTTLYLKDTNIGITVAISDDCLAGGYFQICDNPHAVAGEGMQYRIKSNAYTAATSVMRLDLYDKIVTNIGSEAQVALTGCLYRGLMTATYGATASVPVGVPTVAMTAKYYGWVQTWGPCAILCDASAGTVAAGTIATLSDGVAGAAQPLSGGFLKAEVSEGMVTQDLDFTNVIVDPIIGFFVSAGTNTNYVPVYLQLNP